MFWVNSFCRRVAGALAAVGAFCWENLNGVLFCAGLALVWLGVRAWSPSAATVVAGAVMMVVAALPYVLQLLRVKGQY